MKHIFKRPRKHSKWRKNLRYSDYWFRGYQFRHGNFLITKRKRELFILSRDKSKEEIKRLAQWVVSDLPPPVKQKFLKLYLK